MSGSYYFGKANTGSSSSPSSPSSSPSSSSSSRRSRRGNSEKPKQPQRGLGVAQLEKIRLQEEMGCCFNLLPSADFIHGDPRAMAAYPTSIAPSSSSFSRPLSSSAPSYSLQHNFTMGPNEHGTTSTMYGSDSQPTTFTGWRPDSIDTSERFRFSQPKIDNEQSQQGNLEDSWETRSKRRSISDSFASSNRVSESSENNEEIDLELRLSL